MILVGQYDSPYVRRVAISMHALGLPFTRNTMSVFGDADEMRRINPLGRIPSLVLDDGETLIDSAAILDHLDEAVGPERALVPRAGAARRSALRVMALASGLLDKVGAVVYERTLRPPAMQYAPWLERCSVQVTSGLDALEVLVGERGERVMQPEITVGCVLAYFPLRAPDLFEAARYPRLVALAERFETLPEARLTAPAADEVMPGRLSQG